MENKRFEVHSHTHYSNFRLLDCINRPKDLIKQAINLGLAGISITDHETLAAHPEVNFFEDEMYFIYLFIIYWKQYLCPISTRYGFLSIRLWCSG